MIFIIYTYILKWRMEMPHPDKLLQDNLIKEYLFVQVEKIFT